LRDSSLILLMGAALVGGVLTPVVPASADERAGLADGTVARLASGKLVLEQDGRQCWSKRLGSLAAKKPLSLSVHELADGAAALHVTGEDQAGKPAAAVAVRHPGKCAAKVVWQGSTALAGDLGERSGAAVRFEDLTGDGLPEIVVGQVAEAVALCGTTEAPLLFRRVYDAGSGKLRSVLAKRPALGAPTEIEGASAGADAGPEPLLRMVTPASVSRSACVRSSASRLLKRSGRVISL